MSKNHIPMTVDEATLAQIKEIIDIANDIGDVCYHIPHISVDERLRVSKEYSKPEVTWIENGDVYTAKYTLMLTCANFFSKGEYTKNDQKTTLAEIQHSYDRMLYTNENDDGRFL